MALYAEQGQHSTYSRLQSPPDGEENEVVVFKSCFPNSNLAGAINDAIPAIAENPLAGQASDSPYHTISNAKSIYLDLLEYFKTRQDKLFIVITAPPLSDPTHASNTRAFNNWLVNSWLSNYPYHNVAVFDFYNVLTTNGGSATSNDLGRETGNHHRWWQSSVQYVTDGDNDANANILEYPTGDDHPSRAGNLKATGEFLPLLNIAYNCWKGTAGCPAANEANPAISVQPGSLSFGNVLVGQSSQTHSVTIRNVGTADLQIGTITASGANPDDFTIAGDACSSQTLAPSGQCIVQVAFTPDMVGNRSASLSAPSNDPGSPTAVVALQGIATEGPSITVLHPNGGEQWRAGTTCPISWAYAGQIGKWVKVELLANGVLKRRLTARVSVGQNGMGSFSWRIPPRFVPGSYSIRITSTTKISGSTVTDLSDAPFSIIK
ncbi:MAG: choice-of-anchor D domain-containing protein [Syntrophobacteraceae bacterium]